MFSSLPSIVAQGRRVINNLQRTCSLFLIKTTFSIIVNIFFLVFGLTVGINWPFSPSSFYAWEFCSIGLSAFLLALEPNNERIKGGFIKNIVKGAFPNAFILSLIVISLYGFFAGTNMFDGNPHIYRTISTYVISIGSLMALFEVCCPLNKYRTGVFVLAFACCIVLFVWSIYGTNWLDLAGIDAPRYIPGTAIIIIAVCVLLIMVIMLLKTFVFYLINNKGDNIITKIVKRIKDEKNSREID